MEFAAVDDSTVVQISGSSNNSSSCCFELADQTMDLLGTRHCRNSSSAAQIITADSSSSSNNNNNTTANKSSKIMVEREHMFDKAVTPSDVGKLNRLVIPKQHAERFFPLDPNATDKGLLLCFEDSAGKSWRFRYSYWNSSQSYVLTKGWSRFVKDKKLDAGDIVSFERERHVGSPSSSETQSHLHHPLHQHRNQRLFISWRRRPKPNHHTNHHHDIPRRNFHHHHLNPNFRHQFSRNNSPFCIQNLPHFNGADADVTIVSTSTSVGNNSHGGSASGLGLPLRCIPRWLPFLPSENPPLLSVPVPVPVPMNLQMVTAVPPPSQSSPYLLMEPPPPPPAAAMMNAKAEEDYSFSSGREQSHAKKGSVRLFGVNLESAEENNNRDDDDEQQQQLERTSKNSISSSSSVLHSVKALCVGPRAVLDL